MNLELNNKNLGVFKDEAKIVSLLYNIYEEIKFLRQVKNFPSALNSNQACAALNISLGKLNEMLKKKSLVEGDHYWQDGNTRRFNPHLAFLPIATPPNNNERRKNGSVHQGPKPKPSRADKISTRNAFMED
jgi:hypothetical protein